MDEVGHHPFAHYPPRAGATRVRLCDGPLDGFEVGVEGPSPPALRVNGPRNGDHRIWVTHHYGRSGDRYVYRSTDVQDVRSMC